MSSLVMVTTSPVDQMCGPLAKRPRRILGPCRSARTATARPASRAASRTRLYTISWSAWLPGLQFKPAGAGAPGFPGGLADEVLHHLVVGVAAVAEVQPGHVHAGLDESPDAFRGG